ncbi:Mediator complex subunit Med1 protein [Rutstroemia sp. NJR-2017a BVV2]|nr:Mediator complex subunit Med1 protein [Rutstroemia sp. NJR-2017a BVV2]PQE21898.1 Mediator complex subunit Med1 protein [Rutstroemia sp. NJR-2017a BVV2]
MATPTPGKHTAGGVAATPPVSTPFSTSHLAFSPHGPRSVVPSPSQIKKSSPAGTAHSNQGGYSMGMVGYDSPSAALALGMGEGMDLGIDLHGTGLGVGAGGLGIPGRDEEERRRRLTAVVEILKVNKGRLSEAGLERLARRIGLECLWEDQMGSSSNGRTLIIAGTALALDIDFSNNIVQKVSLSFPDAPESVTRHAKTASDILLKDLQFKPGESPLTKMLDRFAANLERLTMLDKLSVLPALNCHEAIAGIFTSLDKLHKWEVNRLKENDMVEVPDEVIAKAAMCTRSGTPAMHSRERIGLSLHYWQEKRRITANEKNSKRKIWTLLIECAALPALLYPPLRVSDKWISDDIQQADPQVDELFRAQLRDEPILHWLEPDNTLLPSSSENKTDSLDGATQKYPEVMFVAKFEPPVIVPYATAMQIYNSTGATFDFSEMTTYDGLMFPPTPEEASKISDAQSRTIKSETNVPVWEKGGEKKMKHHKNTLFIEKIEYGRTLTELPFNHPRQLVEMLPHLRQFSFLSTLLKKMFPTEPKKASPSKAEAKINNPPTKKQEFSAFMKDLGLSDANQKKSLPLDISLTLTPMPRLQVVFPFKERTANVTFEIQGNGSVVVVGENILNAANAKGADGGRVLSREDLSRMLEVTEDLGTWAEWCCGRL